MLLFGDWCESHQRSLWQVFTIQGEKGKKTCRFSLCGSPLLFGTLTNQAESDSAENSLMRNSLFYRWWKGLSQNSTFGRLLVRVICFFCFFFLMKMVPSFTGCIGLYEKERTAIFGWSGPLGLGSNSPCWFSSICESLSGLVRVSKSRLQTTVHILSLVLRLPGSGLSLSVSLSFSLSLSLSLSLHLPFCILIDELKAHNKPGLSNWLEYCSSACRLFIGLNFNGGFLYCCLPDLVF